MKSTFAILALGLSLAPFGHAQNPTASPAAKAAPQAGREPFVTLTVAPWLTTAYGQWEVQGVTQDGVLRSKLEWDRIDSTLLLIKGRVQLAPAIALGGSFGSGNLFDGRNTDSDSIQPPLNLNDYLFSRSESSTDGDTQLYDLNFYLDLLRLSGAAARAGQRIELFVGYQDYRDRLTDSRGVQTFLNDRTVNLPFPDQGVNAHYEFHWRAARLGVQFQTPIAPRVSIGGSAALLGLVQQNGEGAWTLRDDLRQGGPNLHNESREGVGFDLDGACSIALTSVLELTAGLRWIALADNSGHLTVDYADGTSAQMEQTSISSSRIGVYAGLTAKF